MRANADTRLAYARVELVPYRAEHVERYHAWMSDEHLLEATASERLSADEELAMQREWARDERKCTFIVRDAATHAMIGDCNLFFNDHDDDRACEIEIMIAERAFRRRGLARETLEAFTAYGACSLGVTTFVAKIGFDNDASNALFKSFGFVERSRSEVFEETTYALRARDAADAPTPRFADAWARTTRDSYDAFEAARRRKIT